MCIRDRDSVGFKELPEFVLQRANLLEISIEQETPSVYKGTLEQLSLIHISKL